MGCSTNSGSDHLPVLCAPLCLLWGCCVLCVHCLLRSRGCVLRPLLTCGFLPEGVCAGQKTGAAGAAARAAPTAGSSLRRKKSLQSQHLHPALVPVTQGDAWLAEQQMRPGFLCADVSGGVEKFKVPAFNEVDAEPLPTGLTYIR